MLLTLPYRRTWEWSGSGIYTGIPKQLAQGSHSEKQCTLVYLNGTCLKNLLKVPMAILPSTKLPFPRVFSSSSQTTPFLIPSKIFGVLWFHYHHLRLSLPPHQLLMTRCEVLDGVLELFPHLCIFKVSPPLETRLCQHSVIIDICVEHLDKMLRWGGHRLFLVL